MNLPETPTIPLYCFTAIPKLAGLVSSPAADNLDWLFAPPPPVLAEFDPAYTDDVCIARLSSYLTILADELIRFFFDPPVAGVRSRGALFGFKDKIPQKAGEMLLFLEEQAKANLRGYIELVKRQMGLLLQMSGDSLASVQLRKVAALADRQLPTAEEIEAAKKLAEEEPEPVPVPKELLPKTASEQTHLDLIKSGAVELRKVDPPHERPLPTADEIAAAKADAREE
jgi:hypothetical protein